MGSQIFQAPTKVKTDPFRFESLPAEGRQGCQTDGDNLFFLIQLRRPYADAREKRGTSIDDFDESLEGTADQDQA